jgi:hypothetical protein
MTSKRAHWSFSDLWNDLKVTVSFCKEGVTFMVRQACHERNHMISLIPFALSLSKCRVFRGSHPRIHQESNA